MSDINGLPRGWTTATVGELVSLVNGFAFKPTQWSPVGQPIIRIQNLNKVDATFNRFSGDLPDKYIVEPGDLLFAWSGTPGTSFGAHVWRGERAWLNQHIFNVQFNRDLLDGGYLRLAINHNLDQYIGQAHGGAGLAHITKGRFEESRLLLAPLNEQRRIVAKIDELFSDLDAGVAALERAKAKLARYRAAVLEAAIEGRLTADWRAAHPDAEPASELLARIVAERRRRWEEEQLARFASANRQPPKAWREKYREPERPNFESLPPLPEGWCWASFGQIAIFQNGRAVPSAEYADEGVKLLRPGNLFADGSVRWNEKNTRRLPGRWAEEHPDYIVRGDELVMNLTAQSLADEFLGRTCRTSPEEECLLNQRLARITPLDGLNADYALVVLKSRHFRSFANGLNTGSLIQHMFTSQLDGFPFPLPPTDEQTAIAHRVREILGTVDRTSEYVDTAERRCSRLRQSILRRAFEGRLVPQDPTDEPAAGLLARVAAEREIAGGVKTKRQGKKRTAARGGVA